MKKEELMKETKERLIKLLSASERHRNHYQSQCIRMRGDLLIIKKRLNRMSEDIKFNKTYKSTSKVRYYPGGKDHD